MKLSLILSLSLSISLVPVTCRADDSPYQACVDIYKNSTRDYTETQRTNLELARSFSSFCKRDGSVNTSATGVGLDAIVESIGAKFTFTGNSSQQRLEEFCKVGSSQFDSWNAASDASSTVVTGALSNFNACIDLARSGLHMRVVMNQPDTLIVSGSTDGSYTEFINSITYTESAMRCKSADWDIHHQPKTLPSGAAHLSAAKPFAITCVKIPHQKQDGSRFYDRTTLTVSAGAVSPLAIVFPSDTLNGYELASQASRAVTHAIADLNQAQAESATQKKAAEVLQTRLNSISVEVHAFDIESNQCFGTGEKVGIGWAQTIARVCGNRLHGEASDVHSGGQCGKGAMALACVNIP